MTATAKQEIASHPGVSVGMSRQGWASQLLRVMAWIWLVVEYRVDGEHHGWDNERCGRLPQRSSPGEAWVRTSPSTMSIGRSPMAGSYGQSNFGNRR